MDTEDVKRKLAAILRADVKGYSCLLGADELRRGLTPLGKETNPTEQARGERGEKL